MSLAKDGVVQAVWLLWLVNGPLADADTVAEGRGLAYQITPGRSNLGLLEVGSVVSWLSVAQNSSMLCWCRLGRSGCCGVSDVSDSSESLSTSTGIWWVASGGAAMDVEASVWTMVGSTSGSMKSSVGGAQAKPTVDARARSWRYSRCLRRSWTREKEAPHAMHWQPSGLYSLKIEDEMCKNARFYFNTKYYMAEYWICHLPIK